MRIRFPVWWPSDYHDDGMHILTGLFMLAILIGAVGLKKLIF